MRQRVLCRSFVIFILFSSGAMGRGQSPTRLTEVTQHYAAKDGFTGTVTFATAARVLVSRHYGLADRTAKLDFGEHTRFNIGSVTKQFTAAAVLLLQQDGKLKTSDRMATILAEQELPKSWSEITVRQLLSHTSGLQDYASVLSKEMTREHQPSELIALVRDAPLSFKPGEGFEYSNTNYLLLALIIQKAAGIPYCAFLHERIFTPLEMHDTQCLGEPGSVGHHAIGYTPDDPGEGKPLAADPPVAVLANSYFLGSGNLVSTGRDLVRWTSALHHGQVLSQESYQEMTTPVRNGFGYGLQIGTTRGHMRLAHNGSVPGFYSELDYFPGTDDTVVVLSNQNNLAKGQFTPGTHEIDSELMTLAAEPTASVPSEGKQVITSPRTLGLFTGKYVADDGKQAAFTISVKDGHLWLLQDGPGHTASELRSDYGELDYYFADAEMGLEFSGENDAVIFDLRYERAILFHRVRQLGPDPAVSW